MENSVTKDFIAYEYLTLNVKSKKEPLYIDCYENFGWLLINNISLIDKNDYYINHSDIKNSKMVNIKFKRDRRIKNKEKLMILQRKMESALKNIDKLEDEPKSSGTIYGLIVGFIGTVFMALSVFSITANGPLIIPCIIFGIFGTIGWIIPYFIYKKIKFKKELENEPLIEEQYNVVYDACEQAKNLLD